MSTLEVATELVPEGVLRNRVVSQTTIPRLARLQRFDLSGVTRYLAAERRVFAPEQAWPLRDHFGGLDYETVRLLEREFKRFVALTLIDTSGVYSPSGPVDMYWHTLVLHTRDYERFCADIWQGSKTPIAEAMAPQSPRPEVPRKLAPSDLRLVPKVIASSCDMSTLRALYALQQWDFSYFTEDLIDIGRQFAPEQVWPLREHFGRADRHLSKVLEIEFKKFFALKVLHPELVMVPSGPVDMYWHWLIIHTIEYRDICALLGGFQHHPYGSVTPECTMDAIDDIRAFSDVIRHYTDVFGTPNPQVWHPPHDELPDFEAERQRGRRLFEESIRRNEKMQTGASPELSA